MNKLGQLDKLKPNTVRFIIRYIFRKTNNEIVICSVGEYMEKEKKIVLKRIKIGRASIN